MSKKTKLQPGQVWRGYGGVIRRFIGWTSKGDYVVEDLSAGAIDRLRNTAENIEILFLFLVRDDRGVRVEEVTELGIEDEKTSPLPPVKNIIPAPKMVPPSEGGSGEVGDTIQLARHILIHQEAPCDAKEQRTLARWCLSLACIFNGETLKQLAQCKLEKDKDNEDESG